MENGTDYKTKATLLTTTPTLVWKDGHTPRRFWAAAAADGHYYSVVPISHDPARGYRAYSQELQKWDLRYLGKHATIDEAKRACERFEQPR